MSWRETLVMKWDMEEVCPEHTVQETQDFLYKKDMEWHKENVNKYLQKIKSK